jgi:hypothetical protein
VDFEAGASVGGVTETARVEIPFNGLTNSSAAAVFIERMDSTDSTIQGSDIVEISIVDGNGNDLGNVVNADNPLEITMEFDPASFDPSSFTIYYRNKLSDGTWSSWVDGVQDGTLTVTSVDVLNSTLTFTAAHLTGFGVGAPASSGSTGSSGSGGSGGGASGSGGSSAGSASPIGGDSVGGVGCFISTLTD